MDWSKKVGLQENEIKTQLTASGPKQLEELRAHLADLGVMHCYAVAADELGVSVCARGKLTEKEQQRVDDVRRRCAFIDHLHLPRQQEQMCKRELAMSLLVYGWVCFFSRRCA